MEYYVNGFVHPMLNPILINEMLKKSETTLLVDTESSYGMKDFTILVPRQVTRNRTDYSEIFQKMMDCIKTKQEKAEAIKAEFEDYKTHPYDFRHSNIDLVLKSYFNKKKGGKKNGGKQVFVVDSLAKSCASI